MVQVSQEMMGGDPSPCLQGLAGPRGPGGTGLKTTVTSRFLFLLLFPSVFFSSPANYLREHVTFFLRGKNAFQIPSKKCMNLARFSSALIR